MRVAVQWVASLALLVLVVLVLLSFFGPTVTVWEDSGPCRSPAFGPPGGCLLPFEAAPSGWNRQ